MAPRILPVNKNSVRRARSRRDEWLRRAHPPVWGVRSVGRRCAEFAMARAKRSSTRAHEHHQRCAPTADEAIVMAQVISEFAVHLLRDSHRIGVAVDCQPQCNKTQREIASLVKRDASAHCHLDAVHCALVTRVSEKLLDNSRLHRKMCPCASGLNETSSTHCRPAGGENFLRVSQQNDTPVQGSDCQLSPLPAMR